MRGVGVRTRAIWLTALTALHILGEESPHDYPMKKVRPELTKMLIYQPYVAIGLPAVVGLPYARTSRKRNAGIICTVL